MKKSMKLAAAGLAAVAVVGGTFAYWNGSSTIDNPFSTKNYGYKVVEDYNPLAGDAWEAGARVEKKVNVENTGEYPILARVRFEEKWEREGEQIFKMDSSDPAFFPQLGAVVDGKQTYTQVESTKTGINELEKAGSVVYKELGVNDTNSYWGAVNSEDGYFYSNVILKGGKTNDLLKAVVLLPDTNMGEYEQKEYISLDNGDNYYTGSMEVVDKTEGTGADAKIVGRILKISFDENVTGSTLDKETGKYVLTIEDPQATVLQKVEKTLKAGAEGFGGANYTLSIITEFSQAELKDGVYTALEWPAADTPATPVIPGE